MLRSLSFLSFLISEYGGCYHESLNIYQKLERNKHNQISTNSKPNWMSSKVLLFWKRGASSGSAFYEADLFGGR